MSSLQEPLLAKAVVGGRPDVRLDAHVLDVERSAMLLFGAGSRFGDGFARFFRLDPSQRDAFLLHVRAASLLHDLGKANDEFQEAVRRRRRDQSVRHEHLSALLLHLPTVRMWLEQGALDVDVLTAAVLSHHVKASDQGGDHPWCQPRGAARVAHRFGAPQVRTVLARLAEVAGLGPPPDLPAAPWGAHAPWDEAWQRGVKAARAFARSVAQDPSRRRLLLAVKAALVAADAAGSGLVREGLPLDAWIRERAGAPPLTAGEVRLAVVEPRAAQIEAGTGRPFSFHSFQELTARSGRRVLLLAACAAGKTLAAWRWAEEVARSEAIGRVVFLYPTRGTATEGYRDYVAWAPQEDAALLTGTARYELEAMAANPPDAWKGRGVAETEGRQRLFALAYWSKRYFSATVDQFLGFMESHYASLCLLPALADSALVVDEVHSFDRRMFGDLVAFLYEFDVPVLCMTATLPPARREELERAGLEVVPRPDDRRVLVDLESKERHPRYRITRSQQASEVVGLAEDAFSGGRRVLWVVNTVARSQALAISLESHLNAPVLCYHSRYRLADRQKIHRATVSAFQQRERAAIAVTTQVCEMSLDLDADVLVTELAPIPSLVQRLGRANRHLARGPTFLADIRVYDPPRAAPYDVAELAAAREFLAKVDGRDVSQRELAEALERYAPDVPRADGSARFLDGGYFAVTHEFREGDEFTEPCVLDSDFPAVEEALARRQPIDGFIVSVPRKYVLSDVNKPRALPAWLGIASSACYEDRRGFITRVEELA